MARTIIWRRDAWVYAFGAGFIALIAVAAVSFVFSDRMFTLALLGVLGWTFLFLLESPFGKERIVMDRGGLTLNGNIGLGPIPWDCITDVVIRRSVFEHWMRVYIDTDRLKAVLGDIVVRKKVRGNRRGRWVKINLQLCMLNGIDLETLISEHRNERKGSNTPRT